MLLLRVFLLQMLGMSFHFGHGFFRDRFKQAGMNDLISIQLNVRQFILEEHPSCKIREHTMQFLLSFM
jgi:hypothetical protein